MAMKAALGLAEGELSNSANRTGLRRGVFIGGSGQSGTSTLNAFLGLHPQVLACPFETSFMIAANGLMDVVRAISDEYEPSRLDVILHEFDQLMHHHLCSPRSYPYDGFNLARFFGADRYHAAVDDFFRQIGVARYRASGWTVEPAVRVGSIHLPSKLKRFRLPAWASRQRPYLYYSERQSNDAALAAARSLLDQLFGARARDDDKQIWCEQTSPNQQFADFLLKLCPGGLYINMVRDPLDVALALQAQEWAPGDFALVCTALSSLYQRWFEVRDRLPSDSYSEVHFEELVAAPEHELQKVCQAIGIAYDPCMLDRRPDPRRLQQEHKRRHGADLATYRRILGPIAGQLGYEVPQL